MANQNTGIVRFAVQAAEGTAASASAYGIRMAGGSMPQVRSDDQVYREADGLQAPSKMFRAESWVEGSPEFHVYPKSIGALLYLILGGYSVSGASDPYTHSITPADEPPFGTLFTNMAGLYYEVLQDMRISQLVIRGTAGGLLTVAVTWVGKKGVFDSTEETTATPETTQIFRYYDARAALKVEGTAVATMRDYTLTINRNVSRQGGDDLHPAALDMGALDVTCQATMKVTSAALRNRIIYGGASPSDAAVVVKDVLEAAGSPAGLEFMHTRVATSPGPERSLKLAVPLVAVVPFEVPITTEPGQLYIPLQFQALKGGSDLITATVKNDVATYVPS